MSALWNFYTSPLASLYCQFRDMFCHLFLKCKTFHNEAAEVLATCFVYSFGHYSRGRTTLSYWNFATRCPTDLRGGGVPVVQNFATRCPTDLPGGQIFFFWCHFRCHFRWGVGVPKLFFFPVSLHFFFGNFFFFFFLEKGGGGGGKRAVCFLQSRRRTVLFI